MFVDRLIRSWSPAPAHERCPELVGRSRLAAAVGLMLVLGVCLTTDVAPVFGAPVDKSQLADAVSEAQDGYVEFWFDVREDVCVSTGHGVSVNWKRERSAHQQDRDEDSGAHRDSDSDHDRDDWDSDEWWECDEGPMRVRLAVEDGRIYDVRWRVYYRDHSLVADLANAAKEGRGEFDENGDVDFGMIDAQLAADFLLDCAAEARRSVGEDLILPAVLARDAEVWRDLAGIARDDDIPTDTRRAAVFWLGQEAGQAAMAELEGMIEEPGDLEVREHAVFALSQRPDEESVPALSDIAQSSEVPQLRKTALFWLAQKDDPKVVDLFEEILVGAR